MFLRMRISPGSIARNKVQQGGRILIKRKALKLGITSKLPLTALGAGGRAFKSPRPDQ
jgi:hypothetical protein